jgi:hypothetical protein
MRNATTKRLAKAALLLAPLAAPAPLGAFFWSGPGCIVANMLGMGGGTGGLHFSIGGHGYGAGRGLGYGPPYGYQPYGYPLPGARPHPFAHLEPLMSPAAAPNIRSTGSARDILEANIWSDRRTGVRPFEAGDGNTAAPPNRWRQGW